MLNILKLNSRNLQKSHETSPGSKAVLFMELIEFEGVNASWAAANAIKKFFFKIMKLKYQVQSQARQLSEDFFATGSQSSAATSAMMCSLLTSQIPPKSPETPDPCISEPPHTLSIKLFPCFPRTAA